MPPRYATLAIVALWLGTTGWMAYRDLVPRLRSGEPPPFTIDLTDELSLPDKGGRRDRASRFSAQAVAWEVRLQGRREAAGQKIGEALTTVLRHADRTYELKGRLMFNEVGKKRLRVPLVEVSSLTSSYHVSGEGDLLGLALKVVFLDPTGALKVGPEGGQVELGMEGEVQDGRLWPRALLYERDLTRPRAQDAYVKKDLGLKLRPVPVPERGTVLNTVQPVNRITGLHDGQTWRVPRIDPLEYVLAMLGLGGTPGSHHLDAEVHGAPFRFEDKDVACWRIDYAEPGGKVGARTWVRQDNGLVLQQEAGHQGLRLVLRRDPKR